MISGEKHETGSQVHYTTVKRIEGRVLACQAEAGCDQVMEKPCQT